MTAERTALQRILAKKLAAEDAADAALEFARQNKAFLELEQKRDGLRFQIARLKSQNKDYGSLNAELDEIKRKLSNLERELNIEESSFLPAYSCPICNDTGYVKNAPCQCLKKEIFRVLQEQSGARKTEEYRLETLSVALPEDLRERYKKFASFLQSYANSFPEVPHILFVAGKPASGKTYALTVLSNALMYAGHSVLVYSAYKLNQLFLDYHLAPLERKTEIFRPLLETEFLLIDDLGAENILNNVTLPYLQMLLEFREAPLAFTSNLDGGQLLARYGERIAGRLLNAENGKAILLSGYDFRLKIKN